MKKIKYSYGIVASLVLGLTGCMNNQGAPRDDYSMNNAQMNNAQMHKGHMNKQMAHEKAKKAQRGSSAEVAQKSTPGPKRTAAPQMPVIQ